MHFQNSESSNVVSQHNLVGTRGLVHTLYDLKVAVGEVEVVVIDGHTPGVRQACHYGDAITPVWITPLNLWRFTCQTGSQALLAFFTLPRLIWGRISYYVCQNLIEWTNDPNPWELRAWRPTMPVLVTAQYSLFSWISTVRNSMWSKLLVNKVTGFKPSMSADATLAGMPLSVPWSVQYSLLRRHSRMEVSVYVSDT